MVTVLKKLTVMAVFAVVLMLSGCAENSYNVEADVTIGYDGVVKIADGNPVTVNLKNYGQDLQGEIQVDVYGNGNEQTTYAYPFDAVQGSENNMTFYLPLYMIQRSFDVRIVSGKDTVLEKTVKVDRYLEPSKGVIAVITDKPDRYNLFHVMSYRPNYYNFRFEENFYWGENMGSLMDNANSAVPHIVYLKDMSAFEDRSALNYFNMIYIGDTGQAAASDGVASNVLAWLSDGNLMITEGGEDVSRLVNQLPEAFVVTRQSEGAETVKVEDGVYGYVKPVSRGQIIGLTVDPTEIMDQFSLANGGLMGQIIDEATGGLKQDVQEIYYDHNDLDYELRYIPMEKNPPFGMMAIILGLYIILVGPTAYLVLKLNDRRDLMWFAVPAIVLICILILYIFGFRTRYDEPIVNAQSDITYSDGDSHMTINSDMAVFDNQGGTTVITWGKDEALDIVSADRGYYHYSYEEAEQLRRVTSGKKLLGSTIAYESYKTSLWEPIFLQGTKVLPLGEDRRAASVVIDDKTMMVTNPIPVDMDYCFIHAGGTIYHVGALKAGETVEAIRTTYTDPYGYMENQYDYGNRYDTLMSSAQRLEYSLLDDLRDAYHMEERSGVLTSVFSSGQVKLFGINADAVGYDLKVNDTEVDAYASNVVKLMLNVDMSNIEAFKIQYGDMYPEVSLFNGQFENHVWVEHNEDTVFASIYETGTVECVWSLHPSLNVDSVSFMWGGLYNEEDFYDRLYGHMQGGGLSDAAQEETEVHMYNYRTDSWDVIEDTAYGETTEIKVSDYLSDQNEMKVQYLSETSDMNYRENVLVLPKVQVEGRTDQ